MFPSPHEPIPTPTPVEPTATPPNAALPAAGPSPSWSWRDAFALAWLTGSTLWLVLAAWRIGRLRRALKLAGPAPLEVRDRVASLATLIGLRRPPQTVLVSGNVAPLVWALGGRAGWSSLADSGNASIPTSATPCSSTNWPTSAAATTGSASSSCSRPASTGGIPPSGGRVGPCTRRRSNAATPGSSGSVPSRPATTPPPWSKPSISSPQPEPPASPSARAAWAGSVPSRGGSP